MNGNKKAITLFVIATMVLSMLSAFIAVPVMAELPEGFMLGTQGDNAISEWADMSYVGEYSVYLQAYSAPGDGYEARIVIPMPEGFTLGDLETLSWWIDTGQGYPAHVDITLDVDENGVVDPEDMLTAEMAVNQGKTVFDIETNLPYEWVKTFEYTSGDGYDVIDNTTIFWVSKMGSGTWNAPSGTLAQWKAGTGATAGPGDPTETIPVYSTTTPVLKLEIEVDNWVADTVAYIDNVELNGDVYDLEFETGEPVETIVTGYGWIETPDADTLLEYETTDDVVITIEDLAEDDVDTATFGAVGEYVDIKIDDETAVDFIYFEIFYDDPDDIVGLVEADLIMYWYDGTDWCACSDTGVEVDFDFIWAYIDATTSPSLSDLTGTEFGPGGGLALGAEVYRTGDVITVDVGHDLANVDPIRIETIEVEATSDTDTVGIVVELTETGVDTGVFSGSFPTTGEIPPLEDYLAVDDEDEVTVDYGILFSDTADIDDTPPEITVDAIEDIIGLSKTNVFGNYVELNLDTIMVKVVEATFGLGAFTAVDVPLLYGNNTVTAVATDLVGHTSSSSTWVVSDTLGPVVVDPLATPPKAIADGDTYLTVDVTDEWVDVISVIVDLTDIDGPIDQEMDFNTSGTGLWEYEVTVGALIEDGVYSLNITATDDLGNVNDEEYFLFEVVTDAVPPIIESWTVEYPLGKESAREGDEVKVTVVATDLPAGVSKVEIEGTKITGKPGLVEMTLISDDTYKIDLKVASGVADGTYYLDVAAEDYAANTASDIVEIVILEAPKAMGIGLDVGWNLISLPLIPDSPSIEVILSEIIEDVDVVWSYEGGEWLSYSSGEPSDLTVMVDGKGYWMIMDDAATLTIHGVELLPPPFTPPEYDLVVGWNLIGFKETDDMPAEDYLGTAADACNRIWAYYDGSYKGLELTDDMEPGKGYWIAMSAEGTIYP